MAVEITHVRFGSTVKSEATIVSYQWRNNATGDAGSSDKPTMVDWVDGGGSAHVSSGGNQVPVGAIHPEQGQPYLRTHADGKWTNNLLSLPTF